MDLPQKFGTFSKKEIQLSKNTELRLEYNFVKFMYVKLVKGQAEIMGAQMVNMYYQLPSNQKSIYIYSYSSCQIELYYPSTYEFSKFYQIQDEDKFAYKMAGINQILEQHRQDAFQNFQEGPRVLIIGSNNSGSSTFQKTLVNYAVKKEWKPFYCELEPDLNQVSFPGVLSCAIIDKYFLYENDEFKRISFFYGDTDISQKQTHYIKTVKQLISTINQKIQKQKEQFKDFIFNKEFEKQNKKEQFFIEKQSFCSGIFFSFPNQATELSSNNLQKLVDLIKPNYIFCIHNDQIRVKLNQFYANKIPVIRILQNTGVTSKSDVERKNLNRQKIQNAFFGEKDICIRDKIPIQNLCIYRIEKMNNLPLSYIQTNQKKSLRLTKIDPQINDLRGYILAILKMKKKNNPTIDELIHSEIMNLIFVLEVDKDKQMTIIKPQNVKNNFANHIFVVGEISAKN